MSNISINQIKREAKEAKKLHGFNHTQSLDHVAKLYGYKNFHHAKKEINKDDFNVYFCIDKKHTASSQDSYKFLRDPEDSFLMNLYENQNKKQDGKLTGDEFVEAFQDLFFIKLIAKDVKDYKAAIKKINELFNMPPLCLIHNYELINIKGFTELNIKELKSLDRTTDREMAFGKQNKNQYLWCLHCERTYKNGEHRKINLGGETYEMCPYDNCDGDTVTDAWRWKQIREGHPEYPEVPVHGQTYPMY